MVDKIQPFNTEIMKISDIKIDGENMGIIISSLYKQSNSTSGNFYGCGFTSYFFDDFTSNLHNQPDFKELTELILVNSTQYILDQASYQDKYYNGVFKSIENKIKHVGLEIKTMWFNINPTHGFQGKHHHNDFLLGGTYYLTVPENSGKITFHNPSSFSNHVSQKPLHEFVLLPSFSIIASERDLLIWPGWLEHEITVNESQQKRVTISWGVGWKDV